MNDTIYIRGAFGWKKFTKDIFGNPEFRRCAFVPSSVENSAEIYPKAKYFRYDGFSVEPMRTSEFETEMSSSSWDNEDDELERADESSNSNYGPPLNAHEVKVVLGLSLGAIVIGILAALISGRKK